MELKTKEHYDIMAAFEKSNKGIRLDKESKELWKTSAIYQNGETNKLFLSFRLGYALAKSNYNN